MIETLLSQIQYVTAYFTSLCDVLLKLKPMVLYDFPGGSDSKPSVYNVGDLGSIPGSGRFPGEGNGNPFQYPCLENPMDSGAWCPCGCKESDTTERLYFTMVLYSPQKLVNVMWSLDGRGVRGEWIHVYVWLRPFAVHLKLSQHG